MKKIFISTLLITVTSLTLSAEDNISKENNESNISIEGNISKSIKSDELNSTLSKAQSELKKQMEREKKYAKEQRFYQGNEYDLSSFEVDKNSLDSIPLIEPDYDFNMDDVYD